MPVNNLQFLQKTPMIFHPFGEESHETAKVSKSNLVVLVVVYLLTSPQCLGMALPLWNLVTNLLLLHQHEWREEQEGVYPGPEQQMVYKCTCTFKI